MRRFLGVRGRRRRRVWFALEMACVVAFLALAAVIGARLIQRRAVQGEEAASTAWMRQAQTDVPTAAPATVPPAEVTPAPEATEPAPSMFFESLIAENADFAGMISFEDKSLYVCQGVDNSYYASHRFDGSEDAAGMIYMDARCTQWPMSENLILYGHNMRDGSRFGTLKRFTQPETLLQYPDFEFAGRYETKRYVPIAVFYTTVEEDDAAYFDFAQYAFEDQADFDQYIEEVKSRSVVQIPATAEYGDALLTLATCSEELDRGRLVIVCREQR